MGEEESGNYTPSVLCVRVGRLRISATTTILALPCPQCAVSDGLSAGELVRRWVLILIETHAARQPANTNNTKRTHAESAVRASGVQCV